jgi:hypothetical protein
MYRTLNKPTLIYDQGQLQYEVTGAEEALKLFVNILSGSGLIYDRISKIQFYLSNVFYNKFKRVAKINT